MKDFNDVVLIGFLGADPEIKQTSGGKAMCRLRISTSMYWKGADGEKKSQTEWHTAVAWENVANAMEAQGLHKGTRIMVKGRVHYNTFKKQDGTESKETQILVDDFGVMEKNAPTGGETRTPYTPPAKPSNVKLIDDDDLPF